MSPLKSSRGRFIPWNGERDLSLLISFSLVVLVLTVYFQVRTFEFINYDDGAFVSENLLVQNGLTWKGIKWAFTADLFHDAVNSDYWMPLTVLSRMLDMEVFAGNASGHHLINVWFHLANTLILFVILRKHTNQLLASAFVAALFALHPLQVEAVAWVSARKDVLSAFFGLLALWQYGSYVHKRSASRYWTVFLLYLCAVMSKPMLVTFPILMILFDIWPLKRVSLDHLQWSKIKHLFLEKIPFLVVSALLACLAIFAQPRALGLDSFFVTLGRAFMAYTWYLVKFFIPTNLAIRSVRHYYEPTWWLAIVCAAIVIGLTWFVFARRKKYPHLLVGWLWFITMLSLVITFRVYGDRFMYLPLVGLAIGVTWGVPALLGRWKLFKRCLPVIGLLVLMNLLIASWLQVRHWRNSISVFQHALEVADEGHENYVAHLNLGSALVIEELVREANRRVRSMTGEVATTAMMHHNLGYAYDDLGEHDKAIEHYQKAIEISPTYADTYNSLGVVYGKQKAYEQAIKSFQKAIELKADYVSPYYNLGKAYVAVEAIASAVEAYQKALEIDPKHVDALTNLAHIWQSQMKLDEAILLYRRALDVSPRYGKALYGLGAALSVKDMLRYQQKEALPGLPWATDSTS